MTSPVKLPPLPKSPESIYFEGEGNEPGELVEMYSKTQMVAYAEQAVRQALAELQPVGCCMATKEGHLHTFSSMRAVEEVEDRARLLGQKRLHLYIIPDADKEPPCSPTSSTGQSQ